MKDALVYCKVASREELFTVVLSMDLLDKRLVAPVQPGLLLNSSLSRSLARSLALSRTVARRNGGERLVVIMSERRRCAVAPRVHIVNRFCFQ